MLWGVLEATCDLAKNILSRTQHVCSRLFGIFFLKKNKEMPEHLGKLVGMLDTPDDPTLPLKMLSTEIGAKVTIALVIRPFCITILYHNLLLFIDIFHI
jgi:hypothetical protein